MKKLIYFALLLISTGLLTSADRQKMGINIGDVAPEISLANPDGKIVKLSSLQGKIVLIDFWASWCKPCRMQNPNVVRLYKEYKDANFTTAKGFTVYSVSLDAAKEDWVQAIDIDKLIWENHVSDLKNWKSPIVSTYKITQIPTTYLIDGNGIIIGANLSHEQIKYELAKRKAN